MMRSLRRLFRRPRPAAAASRAAFDRATADPFAAVSVATAHIQDLLNAPADTPGRAEDIAASFGAFAQSMTTAIEVHDTRVIGFLERFLQDADDRHRDRIGILHHDLEALALAFKQQQLTLADIHQAVNFKAAADERRFLTIEQRLEGLEARV